MFYRVYMCAALLLCKQHPIMGADVTKITPPTKFEIGKYYTVYDLARDQAAGDFWGVKVTFYQDYKKLKFALVHKEEEGVLDYERPVKFVRNAQTVTFRHQGRSYILKANKEITDQAVVEKIEAELGDVTFLRKRGIDERWKNAEIIDVDAVDDVERPAKKTQKRSYSRGR